MFKRNPIQTAAILIGAAGLSFTGTAAADAVIFNTGNSATANIALGVDELGQLNVRDPFGAVSTSNASGYFGIAKKFADGSYRDATSPGCLCEGWGVSGTLVSTGVAHSGSANNANVTSGLTLNSFTTDAAAGTGSFAKSLVSLSSLPGLTVEQNYTAAVNASGTLFRNRVTISNTTGSDIADLRYVRAMDWDVPPTEFSEFVTIKGTATTTFLETSHDDGFENTNPLAATSPILPGTLDTDFEDSGPADHGAYFKFNFGTLEDGDTYSFDIFYGAADSEDLALAAIGAEGIELYSLGQQNGDAAGGTPTSFIFGFKGVGGKPVEPPPTSVSEPATIALMGLSLVGLVAARRRKA